MDSFLYGYMYTKAITCIYISVDLNYIWHWFLVERESTPIFICHVFVKVRADSYGVNWFLSPWEGILQEVQTWKLTKYSWTSIKPPLSGTRLLAA